MKGIILKLKCHSLGTPQLYILLSFISSSTFRFNLHFLCFFCTVIKEWPLKTSRLCAILQPEKHVSIMMTLHLRIFLSLSLRKQNHNFVRKKLCSFGFANSPKKTNHLLSHERIPQPQISVQPKMQ